MTTEDWKKLVGKRLLITDSMTHIQCNEWTLLEVSPSGERLKFKTEDAKNTFWEAEDEIRLLEVLP